MKLTICAIAALSVSLTHSLVKNDMHPDQPASTLEMIHLSTYEDTSGFYMVANTESNASYQSWYSSDRKNWKRGNQFTGNGNLRVISFDRAEASAGDQLFVKIQEL